MIYVPPLIVRILNRLNVLSLFRIGYTLKLLNKSFQIPIIENKEGLIYNLNVAEPYLLTVFEQLYKVNNYTFLDAGVNFGQTLLKIKAVSKNAPYIGFEPSGLCSYYASYLIKVNGISHAKLIRCALSNCTGILPLHAQSEGDMRASLLEEMIGVGDSAFQELVPVVRLDSLISIITAAGKDIILKIDVEGVEWLVFQGAEEFIQQYRPIIIFENLPSEDNTKKQQNQQAITDFLNKIYYKIYLIDEENKTVTKIERIINFSEYSKTNYLTVPGEQSPFFSILN